MKMLEKELAKEMKNPQSNKNNFQNKKISQPKTNFQLFINGKKVNLGQPIIPVSQEFKEKKITKINKIKLPQNILKNYSKLPREEPKTKITRLSNKISYELSLPGVKKEDNISIIPVESGFEIKAVSDKKSYFKSLQIALPLVGYALSGEKLSLNFNSEN
jgi:HSP20 family molecular chaperone IbpA